MRIRSIATGKVGHGSPGRPEGTVCIELVLLALTRREIAAAPILAKSCELLNDSSAVGAIYSM